MSIHSLYVGIFYLSGEPISLHLLRCGPFAVDYHSFMGQRLASTATPTRELSRLIYLEGVSLNFSEAGSPPIPQCVFRIS